MNPRGILIVEDSRIIQRIIQRILEPRREAGTRILQAMNGREALRMLISDPAIDLVLLDITLPDMSGFQVLKEIKVDSRIKDIPVLVISTEDDEESVSKAYASGATAFLPKPFRVDELQSWIRKACILRMEAQVNASGLGSAAV